MFFRFSFRILLLLHLQSVLVSGEIPKILNLRQQAELRDRWLQTRLETVVPQLMQREGVDMWIIVAREYNEDPVFRTMAPSTWLSARRRTILLFTQTAQGLERLAVARYGVGGFFEAAWNPADQPDQWQRLAELIEERDPNKIALNYSSTFALADGLTHSEFLSLKSQLPFRFHDRLVSGERLAIGWLELRIPEEMEVYPSICRMAHQIIREGLSSRVIQPGYTTTSNVEWWFRERVRELGLETWFHTSVSVQRDNTDDVRRDFSERPRDVTIRRGDLIHVDFGISYLGLNTDTQQHAYVLRYGETEAPEGLQEAFRNGNLLQDTLLSKLSAGLTGNQVLAAALEEARARGIQASIYSHPLGFHGHAAGPTIGLWDQQEGVPGLGDYPFYPNTVYSIELNAATDVKEWGEEVRIMLEEDAFLSDSGIDYLDGRQTELLLIR